MGATSGLGRLAPAKAVAAVVVGLVLVAAAARADTTACTGVGKAREATQAEVEAFFDAQGKRVLTFLGYSGAGYEDPKAMLEIAGRVLAANDPDAVIVNIGATAEGIGAVYELAKARGFLTTGVVSTQARETKTPLSPCVDHVFFIQDSSWGGIVEGEARLSPTSATLVAVSDAVVAIGGGAASRDELAGAERAGRTTRFFHADMNHELAREKAKRRGEPPPTDFSGAVAAARRAKTAP